MADIIDFNGTKTYGEDTGVEHVLEHLVAMQDDIAQITCIVVTKEGSLGYSGNDKTLAEMTLASTALTAMVNKRIMP